MPVKKTPKKPAPSPKPKAAPKKTPSKSIDKRTRAQRPEPMTKFQNVETPKPVKIDRIEKVEADIKEDTEILDAKQDRVDLEETALREDKAEKRTVECSNCGHKNSFEALVCENCGYDRLNLAFGKDALKNPKPEVKP
jgi:ribosomal protein L40E